MKALCILFIAIISLALGTASLDWTSILDTTSQDYFILFHLRLPRLINAFIVGAALSISGLIFQGLLKNPLAEPYVLGISSGAGLGAVLTIALIGLYHPLSIAAGSFIGALVCIFLVMAIVKRLNTNHIMGYILSGVMINALFSAIMVMIMFISNRDFYGMMSWLMGDLSRLTLNHALISGALILVIINYLYKETKKLNVLAVGDEFAQSLGIQVKTVRQFLFIGASLLAGIAVANSGIIGFVGLIVPHIIRLIKGDDFHKHYGLVAISGGLFLAVADTLTRTFSTVTILPIGVWTAVIGAPLFIILLIKQYR